ncbi:MAG: hypothetical protein MPW14_02390 [Candidatus Manganitrophus sp.]|nr:hypothetical protein [Candidatus Manganitrophus sp.]WDT71937.1 MAG: hypothetical protein MPW17_03580 [Candidatus Manganitrophus sp.]WDT80660.1 MAG: hypothetical protein MPW14_02390 [Candidatus Manganitrophus sp.]
MGQFVDRMIRAAQLDENLYEEVEADKGAMKQAIGVVVLSSLAAGIGTMSQGEESGGWRSARWRPSSAGIFGPF